MNEVRQIAGLMIAIILLVGIAAFFIGIEYQKTEINRLPSCLYDVVIYTPNNIQPGYYIGHNPECIIRMDNTTVIVDAGLQPARPPI